MAALIYALGPADIFIHFRVGIFSPGQGGTTTSKESVYFGTCQTSVDVSPKYYRADVFSDLAGRQVPIVRVNEGVEHEILMTLNRFDMNVWRRIQAFGGLAGNSGIEFATTRGQIHTGIQDVALSWTYLFPNVGGISPADAPVGRYYYSATLRAAKESRVGSRTEELTLMWTASPLFDPPSRGFSLYTEDPNVVLNGLPATS